MNPYSYSQKPDQANKMSATTEPPQVQVTVTPAVTAAVTSDSSTESTTSTTSTATTATTTTKQPTVKKVKSKKDLKNDPARFEPPGVSFNAKLIGIDDVESARGDKMCQEAMHRLKIAIKTSGQHKQRIVINVSLDGIRIVDLRTQAVNHTHAVHRISFISRDITDSRAFGYVFGAGEGKHKFFAIKTEKAAEALVLTLRDLFQAVYETKKKEMEDAKHIQEITIVNAEEAKEPAPQEPVYQVPTNGAPLESESSDDPTYQVPKNNSPVKEETQTENLLNLENELETIGEGIKQMDDLEAMFHDISTVPTTTRAPGTWDNDLASLSQPQTTFSIGGAPFSAPARGFPGQPFGAPTQPGMFAAGAGAAPTMPGQPGMAPNPFQMPTVPPRAGPGLLPPPPGRTAPFGAHPAGFPAPGTQPGGFPAPGTQSAAFPAPSAQSAVFPGSHPAGFPGSQPGFLPGAQPGGFPPTPFPGTPASQPAFPVSPANVSLEVAAANDPFGADPFNTGLTLFDSDVMEPEKLDEPKEELPEPEKKDIFDELVSIGPKTDHMKSPKQMFVDKTAQPRKTLNELKVDPVPAPPPRSPVGFQASENGNTAKTPCPKSISTVPDPFGSSNPFSSGDPFGASDPFDTAFATVDTNPAAQRSSPSVTATPTAPSQTAQSQPGAVAHNDLFGGAGIFGDDDFNLPSPQCPPPPLPPAMVSCDLESCDGPAPAPPPRNLIPHNTPPLPPRPKSTASRSSDTDTSSLSSVKSLSDTERQTPPVAHRTPPLPPRPTLQSHNSTNSMSVPRPRPRASLPQSESEPTDMYRLDRDQKEVLNDSPRPVTKHNTNSLSNSGEYVPMCVTKQNNNGESVTSEYSKPHTVSKPVKQSSASLSSTKVDYNSNKMTSSSSKMKSQSSISDPFVTADPFASDDPFSQSDPFAVDPFTTDPFAEPTHNDVTTSNDPFTCVVASPASTQRSSANDPDPFSVFDHTFTTSDTFTFDKSTPKYKVKLKAPPNDPFGMPSGFLMPSQEDQVLYAKVTGHKPK